MKKLRVLGISGSLRVDSYNRKALWAAKEFAAQAGAEVDETDLKEIALPLYDQDIEDAGTPVSVQKLREAVDAADVLLIASPEYNHSVSGALKNAIDWLSRKGNILDGKVVAIFGASPGLFGTVRGQQELRKILGALNVFFLPQPQVFIKSASEAFDEDGLLKDEKTKEKLRELIEKTLNFARKLQSG